MKLAKNIANCLGGKVTLGTEVLALMGLVTGVIFATVATLGIARQLNPLNQVGFAGNGIRFGSISLAMNKFLSTPTNQNASEFLEVIRFQNDGLSQPPILKTIDETEARTLKSVVEARTTIAKIVSELSDLKITKIGTEAPTLEQFTDSEITRLKNAVKELQNPIDKARYDLNDADLSNRLSISSVLRHQVERLGWMIAITAGLAVLCGLGTYYIRRSERVSSVAKTLNEC